MRPPKLTSEQLQRLHHLEPSLHAAALRGDYESAQQHALDIQNTLRATGHETRLMQAKVWLFEAAMEAGYLNVAVPGFVGIRGKASKGTRLHLEATTLLAICYLRQKNLAKAEPLIAEVLKSRNIRSESGRRRFLRRVVSRFEEEGLLGALVEQQPDHLGVTFQQVVHSMKTGEADCVEAIPYFGDIEWTSTRMPDSLPFCERSWRIKFFPRR
jgi:hypothetical protein